MVVYCGGRGSGKTLSMSAEGANHLVKGENVWTNYVEQIKFFHDGKLYQSKPIEVEDLLAIQKTDIRDGAILLDEWNLWCNSRRSGAVLNYVFNGVIQLIRKRKLSFYITTQVFMTLDKFIREQTDLTVQCFDLHYKYRNIPKGMMISQTITDWSGVFTGRPIVKWDDWRVRNNNTRVRYMRGGRFFGIYSTEQEYDILDIYQNNAYSFDRKYKTIGAEGVRKESDSERELEVIGQTRDTLLQSGKTRIESAELVEILKASGVEGSIRGNGFLGQMIRQSGFKYKPTKKGNFYVIGEE